MKKYKIQNRSPKISHACVPLDVDIVRYSILSLHFATTIPPPPGDIGKSCTPERRKIKRGGREVAIVVVFS